MSERGLVLRLIGSLTLCDHMGDVGDAVDGALGQLGIELDWGDWEDLGEKLGEMGVTTLFGTSLKSEPGDD